MPFVQPFERAVLLMIMIINLFILYARDAVFLAWIYWSLLVAVAGPLDTHFSLETQSETAAKNFLRAARGLKA